VKIRALAFALAIYVTQELEFSLRLKYLSADLDNFPQVSLDP